MDIESRENSLLSDQPKNSSILCSTIFLVTVTVFFVGLVFAGLWFFYDPAPVSPTATTVSMEFVKGEWWEIATNYDTENLEFCGFSINITFPTPNEVNFEKCGWGFKTLRCRNAAFNVEFLDTTNTKWRMKANWYSRSMFYYIVDFDPVQRDMLTIDPKRRKFWIMSRSSQMKRERLLYYTKKLSSIGLNPRGRRINQRCGNARPPILQ